MIDFMDDYKQTTLADTIIEILKTPTVDSVRLAIVGSVCNDQLKSIIDKSWSREHVIDEIRSFNLHNYPIGWGWITQASVAISGSLSAIKLYRCKTPEKKAQHCFYIFNNKRTNIGLPALTELPVWKMVHCGNLSCKRGGRNQQKDFFVYSFVIDLKLS